MVREKKDYTINVTRDEFFAVSELLTKMRMEQIRKEAIEKCKMAISFEISDSIAKIGLEETKRIVRELNRELREKGE
jgi:hypothetical protein